MGHQELARAGTEIEATTTHCETIELVGRLWGLFVHHETDDPIEQSVDVGVDF